MSWIGISTGRRAILLPDAFASETTPLLLAGTILIEVQFNAKDGQRQTVIDLDRAVDWPRRFRVLLGAEGEMLVEYRQGSDISTAALHFPKPDQEASLRITLAWHAPERIGLMTLENLDSGHQSQSVFADPHPWPPDDFAALIRHGDDITVDPSTTLLACADTIEPVGPNAGFAIGTLIDTAAGPKPVEKLRPGDLVQTSDHGMQPIRQILCQEVPAYGQFAPIRLRAPFFGLTRDLTVAPDHRLMIAGVDAEYLFGTDAVLVEARHLAKMAAAPLRVRSTTIRYVQVLLDAHVCLSVAGAWAESLYLGDLADHPTRHATSALADIPACDLPRHTRIASPQLCGYEAMVLVSALCA